MRTIPRVAVLCARAYLGCDGNRLNETHFSEFVRAAGEIEPLRLNELGGMLDGLKFALLEAVIRAGAKALESFASKARMRPSFAIGHIITSLRFIGERDWRQHSRTALVVRSHAARRIRPVLIARMDFESRELYRQAHRDSRRQFRCGLSSNWPPKRLDLAREASSSPAP